MPGVGLWCQRCEPSLSSGGEVRLRQGYGGQPPPEWRAEAGDPNSN
jgi:hypothetical protein